MTVVALCGFEMNSNTAAIDPFSASATVSLNNTSSYSSTQARTGSFSIRCNPASAANGFMGGLPSVQTSYTHFGMYVASLPSVDRVVFGGTGVNSLNVRLTPAGALAVYNNTTLQGTSSAAFASPGWHWVGVRGPVGTSVTYLQIDGVNEVTGTFAAVATPSQIGFSNSEASAVDAYFDDFIQDDAGFLAPSKVAMLLPISDNARGANWFKADGTTTTNLWQSVDNIPPAGVASASESTTPLASIRHTGGANNAYDANMTTYSTAGVVTGDTVLAVMSFVRTGEDIATGAKILAQGLVSNPAPGVGSTFAAGNDAGAHGIDSSSGIWVTNISAITAGPSVTIGSSPVLRMSRPETASRVACVDFMAVYMAWTPSAAAQVSYVNVYPPFVAQ